MRKIFISAIVSLCLSGCARDQYIAIQGFAQGSVYEVKCKIGIASARRAASLKEGIDSILNVIDRSVSGYNAASLLSRYNSGDQIIDDGSAEFRTFALLTAYGDSLRLKTGGALDTRAAELFDIWGFGFKNGQMPDSTAVEEAKHDRSKLNFNAIAQGYSADMVASYLQANGIEDMMVNIGGEIYCNGLNPNGKRWTLGIDKPFDGNMTPGKDISCKFEVPSERLHGVVTSGNYRKFYIVDGVKYPHTIDPRTGYPVRHSLLSVTIMAPDATIADAMATYCMVIGPEQARDFIESRDDLEACLISSDGVWCSKGFILNQ
ncbi:MAG: FAD:protein FMN transferase [Bacteroidales bacterium]|nr:FAD:protein FMN transferase [Candidatus Hennigimonas equi]